MLSAVRESRLRAVRAGLTFGWLLLIVSLFWDPVTPALTDPANLASPFHLKGQVVTVQGQALPEAPYAMSNRIFWTMIVPLLPLFFMVAGHETWRRLCPLSFVSQLPRYLGLNRKHSILVRRTGRIERQLALVKPGSWWQRNVIWVQFGLLFLGLNLRILFINSDRTALAVFFLSVIAISLSVGYLWGGKTWCNYLCPISVVQRIYTQPRGLLESAAHLKRAPVSQSMCRTSGPDGDQSICVGCTPNCPDIDIERAYWKDVETPATRHVYYAFFGLIVGFYGFYYLHAGNWDYYFSGAWTHEPDQLARLMAPGLYLAGQAVPIPKLLAAPLVLGLFCLAAVGLGRGLEALYRAALRWLAVPLTEPEIVGRCLAFSAYVSINTFYLFGGRPNLMLLPPAALRVVDMLIVALTTLWFLRAIQRNPTRYRRESLASSLLQQLKNLKVDISRFLEGRRLEELQPDEVYVLAKTLPSFSREQRLQAYRNILGEALRTGKTDSRASLELLREVRVEIGVTDEEHAQLVEEFGATSHALGLDPEKAASYEDWLRLDNYRRAIEPLLLEHLEAGRSAEHALEHAAAALKPLQELYQITDAEHARTIAELAGSGGVILERANGLMGQLAALAPLHFQLGARMAADPEWEPLGGLLVRSVERRGAELCGRLFSLLLTLGDREEARLLAARVAALEGARTDAHLERHVSASARSTWADSLPPAIVQILRGGATPELAQQASRAWREALAQETDLAGMLEPLVRQEDGVTAALALAGVSLLDLARARTLARQVLDAGGEPSALLGEVIGALLPGALAAPSAATGASIALTVLAASGERQAFAFRKDHVTVGRGPDNDVPLLGPTVNTYHLKIERQGTGFEVCKSNPLAAVYVNGVALEGQRHALANGDRLSFAPPPQTGTVILVEWSGVGADHVVEPADALSKLIWLTRAGIFQDLELRLLAELAMGAEVRQYPNGAFICREGDEAADAFVLQSGEADVLTVRDGGEERKLNTLREGAVIGELAVITGQRRAASIRVASAAARVLVIRGDNLRQLMESQAQVAVSLLKVVASYVRK